MAGTHLARIGLRATILILLIGAGNNTANAVQPLGSGRFTLPIECQTADEIEKLLRGELGELYFEIMASSTCRLMENFTDTAFRLEACTGPAAEVTFLDWEGKPVRQIWVSTESIYTFIDTRETRNLCIAEAVRWKMEK